MISVANQPTRTSQQLVALFRQQGYVVLQCDEIPLQPSQWGQLQSLLERMDYAKVVGEIGRAHV